MRRCTAPGHTESTLVVFDPQVIDLEGILKVFWETHDPTQEMQQGNDVGTQYRSAVYTVSDDDANSHGRVRNGSPLSSTRRVWGR